MQPLPARQPAATRPRPSSRCQQRCALMGWCLRRRTQPAAADITTGTVRTPGPVVGEVRMRWRVPLGAALLVLLALPATGFGWFRGLFSRSSYRAAPPAAVYYCPVPVIAVVPAAVPLPY